MVTLIWVVGIILVLSVILGIIINKTGKTRAKEYDDWEVDQVDYDYDER